MTDMTSYYEIDMLYSARHFIEADIAIHLNEDRTLIDTNNK